MSDWWDERRSERSARGAAAAPAQTHVAARLGALADLHTNGHLTDEEYAAAKAKVLAGE
jgi:hypothetical protein